jgi:hypothetical protein
VLATTTPSGRPSRHSQGPVAFAVTMADATSDNRGPVIATISTDIDGWFQAISAEFLELVGRLVVALSGLNLVDLVHPLTN